MLKTVLPLGKKNAENAVYMRNNINNSRYLQNYSKMNPFLYDSPPSFSAAMSECRVFWPFFRYRLTFWKYLRLFWDMVLKPNYQKSAQVKI